MPVPTCHGHETERVFQRHSLTIHFEIAAKHANKERDYGVAEMCIEASIFFGPGLIH